MLKILKIKYQIMIGFLCFHIEVFIFKNKSLYISDMIFIINHKYNNKFIIIHKYDNK
jgi:hypothetical protein